MMWTDKTRILLRMISTKPPTSKYLLSLDLSLHLQLPIVIIQTLINARSPFFSSNYMHIWICKFPSLNSVFSLVWCNGNSLSSPHTYAFNLMYWCSPPFSEKPWDSVCRDGCCGCKQLAVHSWSLFPRADRRWVHVVAWKVVHWRTPGGLRHLRFKHYLCHSVPFYLKVSVCWMEMWQTSWRPNPWASGHSTLIFI